MLSKHYEYKRGGVILAGGSSLRFGKNKALVMLNGKPLIRHVIDNSINVVEQIVITIGQKEDPRPFLKVLPQNIKVTKDLRGYKNPLNGILSGITVLNAEYCLVLPCDTPYIKHGVLEILFREADGYDSAIPIWPNGYIEPLIAVYKVEPTVEALRLISVDKNSKVDRLISLLERVRYVDINRFKSVDPYLTSFLNINRPSDLTSAENMPRR
ncbi:molybdenum cofactor guanylyltransferase [Candidatus Bathyarchaeota archaeon]|nr:molybdenum cofactor guanylyltransferase [Candidatus Bathyarchaeota archaeon]MBS7628733.1 molybdenum cofactor guanylyltransferase [Candidatus Bathyarchaeota archaeon]